MALMGGKDKFAARLDEMFTYVPAENSELPIFSTGMIGQYAHGNEPSHHVIYLYNKAGKPWQTAYYASKVMHELYFNAPAGLCGNEDCGQMSAWYILSSLGFYQVAPGRPVYSIGRPWFEHAEVRLPNGKSIEIKVDNYSKDNMYIESVKLNGKALDRPFFNHSDIVDGAVFEYVMTDKPTEWGVSAK